MTTIDVHSFRRMYITIISALCREAIQSTTIDIYAKAFKDQVLNSEGANWSLIDIIRNNNHKTKKEENNND